MSKIDIAGEWIRTDEAAVRADVTRLGLAEATEYQMELIKEAIRRGDTRWMGLDEPAMRTALGSL